jgi:hypothetical protein
MVQLESFQAAIAKLKLEDKEGMSNYCRRCLSELILLPSPRRQTQQAGLDPAGPAQETGRVQPEAEVLPGIYRTLRPSFSLLNQYTPGPVVFEIVAGIAQQQECVSMGAEHESNQGLESGTLSRLGST